MTYRKFWVLVISALILLIAIIVAAVIVSNYKVKLDYDEINGYWVIDEADVRDYIYIKEENKDGFIFDWHIYGLTTYEDIGVKYTKADEMTFSTDNDGMNVKGTITFNDNVFSIVVEESDHGYVASGTVYNFSTHLSSKDFNKKMDEMIKANSN